jgi:hypothetical protein
MLTAEAFIETERASRYLHQFCKHAAAMPGARGHRVRAHDGDDTLGRGEVRLHVDASDDQGIITFDPWGRAILRAEDGNTLTVRVEATDEQNLHRIQDIITRDIERFGRRDQLTVTWQRPQPQPGSAPNPGPEHPAMPTTSPGRRTKIVLTTAGALALALTLALHLGFGGAALVAWRWLGWTAIGGVAVAAVVLVLGHATIPVAALRLRRHPRRHLARRSASTQRRARNRGDTEDRG